MNAAFNDVEGNRARDAIAMEQKERYNTTVTEEEGENSSEFDDPRARSRSPSAPSEAPLFRGTRSNESYDMSVLPRSGGNGMTALPSPEFERSKSSRSRGNFSQPFGRGRGTFFDDSR